MKQIGRKEGKREGNWRSECGGKRREGKGLSILTFMPCYVKNV